VPADAQQKMYKTIAALKPSLFAAASGTEVAEIAVCLAIGNNDPLVLAHAAKGARAVRKGSSAANRGQGADRFERATVSAVAALIAHETATALVCGGRLQHTDDYRRAFGFAARHKLPIIFLVANSLTPGKKQSLDLRTLYAELGIPVFSMDGNDAIAAYRVTTEALHNARHGRGPCVIEALTFGNNNICKTTSLNLLKSYMERHDNWPL
jgi:hypothetical protein